MLKQAKWIMLSLVMLSSLLAEKVEIKLATIAPEGTLWARALRDVKAEMERKIPGVSVKVYAGEVVRSEENIASKLEEGKIEGALFIQTGWQKILPTMHLLSLPYIYPQQQEWQQVAKGILPFLEKQAAKKGYYFAGLLHSGQTHVFARTPFSRPQELFSKPVWSYEQDPIITSYLEKTHNQQVALEINQVLPALKKGQIQAVYVSPYLLVALGWHQQIHFSLDLPVSHIVGGGVIRHGALAKLPSLQVKKLKRIFAKHLRRLNHRLERENKIARKILVTRHGVKFQEANQQWRQKTLKIGLTLARNKQGELYSEQQLEQVLNFVKK